MASKSPASSGTSPTRSSSASAAKVAERAYSIWEKEGRPDGQDLAHWFRAESELSESRPARSQPKKAKASSSATAPATRKARSRRSGPHA